MLMLIGMIVQVHAKIVLGRSMGCVAANRGLKFYGPYRFVRHPMYAGYLIIDVAFVLMNPSDWNCGIYALCYAAQIPRLLAEERLLSQDSQYKEYRADVRYRLIPGVF
jgi:protein-S-isoprenylcysteine O-methyltransferase Ste14